MTEKIERELQFTDIHERTMRWIAGCCSIEELSNGKVTTIVESYCTLPKVPVADHVELVFSIRNASHAIMPAELGEVFFGC